MPVAPTSVSEPNHQWCWIGERDSEYLDSLTQQLADLRPELGDASSIDLSLIDARSPAKLHKILAKTRADVFVWAVPTSGISEVLGEIDACRRRHRHSRQIAAGIASPTERLSLFEAGCCWHVEQPHHWGICLSKLYQSSR